MSHRLLIAASLSVTALLTACGPVPVAQAERQCLDRALLAAKPRGEVSIGANSDGKAVGGIEVEISSDYIMGRDPSAIFDTCVMRAAGVPPSRPLYSFPEWTG